MTPDRSLPLPIRQTVLALLTVLWGAGCASGGGRAAGHPAPPGTESGRALSAVLWVQTSAEYEALARLVYRGARASLAPGLADPTWTAATEQSAVPGLPPAVILDVDETVLDNTPYQARLLEDGSVFGRESWSRWVREAEARAIPGAVEYTRAAADAGVTVFYVTNRDADLETATRENLQALGFPLAADIDPILTRGERETWGSDKSTRRAWIAERYRVLALVGDDLADFVRAEAGIAERRRQTARYADRWGTRWFVLPNPMYGSWERALLAAHPGAAPAAALRAALETRRTP